MIRVSVQVGAVGRLIVHRVTWTRMCLLGAMVYAGLWAAVAGIGEADGGERSEPARLVERSLLLDVEGVGDGWVAVGERGHVLRADAGAKGWNQVVVPTRSMLTAAAAAGERIWAVGHDAVILSSTDRGATWERQHWDPDLEMPLFDIWADSADHAIAVGAYGLFLETTDGGATWTRREEFDLDEPHLYQFTEAPDGALYLAGEFGSIYVSTDRGAIWEKLSSPYEGSFFGSLALADGSVLVFGLRGNLYRSTDQGETWTAVGSGTKTGLFCGLQVDDRKVVLAGLGGMLVISDDGGAPFRAVSSGSRLAISRLVTAGDRFLAVGEGGIRWIDELPEGGHAGDAP